MGFMESSNRRVEIMACGNVPSETCLRKSSRGSPSLSRSRRKEPFGDGIDGLAALNRVPGPEASRETRISGAN